MFRNQSIFTQLHPAGSTRLVVIPDGQVQLYSKTAVGIVQGAYRTLPALMAPGVADGDLWYTINFENDQGGYVETVAVLGATSEEQAKAWAHKQFGVALGVNRYASVAESDEVALKRYLDRPSASVEKVRIYQRDLDTLRQQITGKPVTWADNQECTSHGINSRLLLDMIEHDVNEELMDTMGRAEFAEYVARDAEQVEYDALIVQNMHLEQMMNRLTTAMAKAAVSDITVTSLTQSKPFKRHGVVNVACLFELSDGQSITIVFHNPDSTPGRLGPGDVMTSWKWLLNKRDISAAVQPKQGENVNLNQLAVRMMKLVMQNSARFKRTQLKQKQNLQFLDDADQRIGSKQEQLTQVLKECEQLQRQIDEASQAQPLETQPITLTGNPITSNEAARLIADLKKLNADPEWSDGSGHRYSVFHKRIMSAQEGDLEAVNWAKEWLSDLDAQEADALRQEQERLAAQEVKAQQREATRQQEREAGTADNPIYQAWLNTLESPTDVKNHEFMAWVSDRDAEFKQQWTGTVPATPDQNSDYALARIAYFQSWAADHLADRLKVGNTMNPDQEFLQNIITGTVEATTVDIDHMIELAEKYQADDVINALVEQALEIINQAEQAAAQSVA